MWSDGLPESRRPDTAKGRRLASGERVGGAPGWMTKGGTPLSSNGGSKGSGERT